MVTDTDLTVPRTIEGLTLPDPRDHYGQILSWIVCWPWNLLWILSVHNPFRYIGEFVMHEIQSMLDEIATGEFSGIAQDLDEYPPCNSTPTALPEAVRTSPPPQPNTLASNPPNPPIAIEVSTSEVSTSTDKALVAAPDLNESLSDSANWEIQDQSDIETVEDTAALMAQLKKNSPAEVAPTPTMSNHRETYTPPPLPPTHQPEPWYFTPGSRNQNGGSLADARPRDPHAPPASN